MIDSLFSPSDPLADPLAPPVGAIVTAETLRLFGALRDLDLAQRQRILAQMQLVTVPARTILLAAGQPGHAVYFLLEGTVKICLERPASPRKKIPKTPDGSPLANQVTPSGKGAQVMLNLCGPGAVLGELSVIDGVGHSASVLTREPCRLLWIGKDPFFAMLREMPTLSLALLRGCSTRLRNATHQLHAYATLDATGRIAHAVLGLAQRFGTPTPDGLRLDIGLTQPELADLVGLTRTRVNTVIAVFKRNGWLTQEPDGALLLHDREKLVTAARQISVLR